MSEDKSRLAVNKEVGKLWEDYANKYNHLSEAMMEANIDIELLADLVRATIALYTNPQSFDDDKTIVKQTSAQKKPKYFILEVESHRKDVHKLYGGRSGWLYKLVKTLREYVDEDEADRDLSMLRAGEITEDDVFRKRKK